MCRQALQRELQIQAAKREVATIFKKNQEKQLKDRLAREAAEKERCQKAAKEMREKIEADLQRQLEAERQAAINLKEMKAAQYEADLAAHKRRQRMEELKAKQNRTVRACSNVDLFWVSTKPFRACLRHCFAFRCSQVQEVAWEDVMAWDKKDTQAEHNAKLEAMRLFSEQRSMQQQSHDDEAAAALEELRATEAAEKARRAKSKAKVRSSRSSRSSPRSKRRLAKSERGRLSSTSPTNPQKPPTWNWGHFGANWWMEA